MTSVYYDITFFLLQVGKPTMSSKKQPTTIASIFFRDPKLPTCDELISYAKEMDKQFPNDSHNRAFLRKMLQREIGISDPWEKLGYSWTEFKKQCGWSPTRATQKLLNQSSKHASVDYLRTASEERLTWGTIYTKPDNGDRFKVVMGAGDFHDQECDPFAWRMWINKVRYAQPDIISIHGDMFDLPEFSRHTQDSREYMLLDRLNIVHDMLGEMREASPESQIDLIEGNHEARIHRLFMDVAQPVAGVLDGLHNMDLRKFLGLDEFEINYIAKGDLFAFTDAQLRRAVLESERVYYNTLWVRHHPPKKENISMPGFHGHHHAHNVTTHFNPNFGGFEWHQLGGMHKRQASYTDGRKWNTGFITAYVDTVMQRVSFDYTAVGDTCCILGGKFYERHPNEFWPGLLGDLDNRLNNAENSPAVIRK